MCGCECFITAKIIRYSLLTWRDIYLKQLKDKSNNAQNRRSSEIESRIFEKYKNSVRPNSCYIHNTSTYMSMEKCVPVPMHIMDCHTANLCCYVVINSQIISCPVRRKIKIEQTHFQHVIVSTETYHVILCISYVHTSIAKHVKCVTQCLALR